MYKEHQFKEGFRPHPTIAPGVIKQIFSLVKKKSISNEQLEHICKKIFNPCFVPIAIFDTSECIELLYMSHNNTDYDKVDEYINSKLKRFLKKQK